jgi:ribosomal protein S18 acetylase RimI-like enzyme
LQSEGEVTAIYLLDTVKRRGFGRLLFTQLLGALAGKGFASAGLWVLTANRPACRFYEAMGGCSGATRTEQREGALLSEIAYRWNLVPPVS